ncbi:MAG: hypothetical protein A2788_02610 [Candidatus Abawacabacteria bacterium RIFCSPHIGHO2_01_FULL_46_8]|uniref:Bacterial sugar transferase domain-containing protein n=1 Tax=Candidatus Abawacabacteria bacterium RIFCSPHIGHO2_01_FULL_46_8 TaxID=1817815 RepID=A0A1F4XM92_9BACT|nr:MAG: hypothetical protein A2788_02610 [Candidatus Abawacabacteria bacterium RIFCSPHIGHO2_01_FULL_46_8]
MKRSEILFAVILLPLDFLAVIGSFSLAYWLRTFTDLIPGVQLPIGYIPPFLEYSAFLWKAALLFLVIGVTQGVYIIQNRANFSRELAKVLITALIWFAAVLAWFFLRRAFFFSRLVLIYGFVFSVLLLILLRLMLKLTQNILFRWNIAKTRVLILGANSLTDHVYAALKRNPAYEVVGCVKQLDGVPELAKMIAEQRVEELIQTQLNLSQTKTEEVMAYCQENHLCYRFLPDLIELHQLNINVQTLAGLPVIELSRTPLEGWGRVLKRSVDLAGSGLGLLLLSPVLLAVTILVKLDSPGPVLFSHVRISQGKKFPIYKFRSMVLDAEAKKRALLQQNEREGPLFKLKEDPRITKLGAFLRKWSIDELPQLINVFKGEMSLVGPRPHLEEEIKQYKRHHKKVLAIKAGITGMAQVSGRSNLDFEEEVRLDTFYVEHWSIWLDLNILFKTVYVVLFRPGKY